ncbi:MAG: hypothetical protein KIT83_22485 [Bryobacterales bacterium]|nr:hypothetical protein [Bryobacterales bacterium]
MTRITVCRLGAEDHELARCMFVLLAEVFEEDCCELSSQYISGLLGRNEFWAIAAVDGNNVVGGLTAHVLPMTRSESSEAMIYDIAVRED